MKLETLQNDMIIARKCADKQRVAALSNMIDAVKKASMTTKGRIDITEQLVDETLIKYQKIVQEQYDSCPATPAYMSRRLGYCAELTIVKEYAPQLLTNECEIKEAIIAAVGDMSLVKSNRGNIMKVIAPMFKGKADMSIVNKVLGGMLQ